MHVNIDYRQKETYLQAVENTALVLLFRSKNQARYRYLTHDRTRYHTHLLFLVSSLFTAGLKCFKCGTQYIEDF